MGVFSVALWGSVRSSEKTEFLTHRYASRESLGSRLDTPAWGALQLQRFSLQIIFSQRLTSLSTRLPNSDIEVEINGIAVASRLERRAER